ncbi:hypothetical protein TW65_03031 [Stemphylium lycopersici]|uniref:P-loop containing nucleoside triphosphate hydrolase protein n=1 Tax=Stemphylium lycopersici TaxID=183478 RepID=A0A364MT28_STELY|nr:hypothetical protein TW65_03031 [Stemphylium lycopersici]RAR02477.1 P-loop containing nucleoside triphosphate hydrolase protein [Stemphylium lycopersici]
MADRYSFSLTTFSPSGKLVQIEYALNAVNQGVTSLGIKATNGIVLATEKKSSSPLIDSQSSSKISLITPNLGMVYSGMGPDYRVLVDKARKVSHTGYKRVYNEYPPTRILVQDVARVMQEATQSGGVRPYGVSLLIAGWDDGIEPEAEGKSDEQTGEEKKKVSGKTGGILKGGPSLYQVDPSGSYFPWKATAIGKSATSAKTFLEKRYTDGLELEDAIHIALLTLKETIEGEMNGETVEIGIVGPPEERLLGVEGVEGAVGPRFRKLSPSEVEDYLTNFDGDSAAIASPSETFRLRGYQAEMVEESMKGNIIVVMDTGSGKTHMDDIELWTKQSDWDAVLQNVRVVLSTHQVLLDALTHGFVRLSKLALLIFDEAHHCREKHPAHRIMEDFYMPQLQNRDTVLPKILGLSASPVMKAAASKEGLESELINYAHQPELMQINYPPHSPIGSPSVLLLALKNAYTTYDLMKDPYVISLLEQQRNGYDVSRQLQKLWNSNKTYCHDQLKQLVSKADAMEEELGQSAMEYYLHQCVDKFASFNRIADEQLLDITTKERQHLLDIFKTLPLRDTSLTTIPILDKLSHKVNVLVDTLVSEATGNPKFTGLVFVEQRVWVASLAEILTAHPRTQGLLRIGTFVGESQTSKRKSNICSYAEPKNQQKTLDDFRAGSINLVLATSVLEEGIDVSSCHLVVCFERPKNLKSFVQRRGRARQQQSRYFILVPDTGVARSSTSWQLLEAEMRKAYEDDKRQVELARKKEQIDEDGSRYFKVESTGALLTLDNASQHLYHFCARLASGAYVETRPEFDFTNTGGRITAKVTLPISVDPAVRTASSSESWITEKMAQKDAAFEAYKALYVAGLVNENLLPVRDEEDHAAQYQIRDDQPSLVPVSQTLDPWQTVAQSHHDNPSEWHCTLLEVTAHGEKPLRMILSTPSAMPAMPDIILYWNETKRYTVTASSLCGKTLTDTETELLRSITWKMLHSVFGVHIKEDISDFLYLLAPCHKSGRAFSYAELREWHTATGGQGSAPDLLAQGSLDPANWGLITQLGDMRKFIAKTLRSSQSQGSSSIEETLIEAVRFPKRRDFLHPVYESENKSEAYTRVEILAAAACVVDKLPTPYTILALLFPSIAHKLEVYMVADRLRTTLLKQVDIGAFDLPVVVTALTSSAAEEGEDYQRMEFLGDCILKFITSLHLMAAHLRMPEGMLTGKKGKLVSNGYLARATLAAGLDQFIFYKRFTGAKWKPRYISQMLDNTTSPPKQQKSSKLIADVIESLIGASYLVGGFPKAFACVQALLPSENWTPIPEANDKLYNAAPCQDTVLSLDLVESLIGHTFHNKALLLEALTHSTFRGLNTNCSYEREEFLGDAVLDYIVSKRLYAHKPGLPHHKMHGIRTAMVNASFLTYCMFETTVEEELTNKETFKPEVHQRALWQFLRSSSYELVTSRAEAMRQHVEARSEIAAALEHDARFPWHALSLTDPPKFLSDIVESVLGALYIDSHGSFAVCEEFVHRLGILSCLERILRDGVDCLHPKERLGILAVDKGVKYVRVTSDEVGGGGGANGGKETGYVVQVRVDGKDIGGVVKGVKRLQAETIAAWKAIALLERVDVEDEVMGEEEDDEFFDAEEGGGILLEDV